MKKDLNIGLAKWLKVAATTKIYVASLLLLCLQQNLSAQCIADFNYNDNCEGLKVKFTNQSTHTGSLLSTTWLFGTSGTSTDQNPEFTFTSAGTYQVKLVITTSGPCTDSITKTIAVYSSPQPTVGDTVVCLGQSTQFTANLPSGVTYQSFNWNFGNSSTSTQTNPFHNYTQPGIFYPFLKVIHTDGTSCELFTKRVKVMDLPQASFSTTTIADTLCFSNNTVCINGTSSPGSTGAPINKSVFIWDDGAQTTTTDTNACHTYTDNLGGSYVITLEVTDTNGCISRYTNQQSIVIRPKIEVKFSHNASTDCYGITVVDFTNTSQVLLSNVSKFLWDFGDGTKDSMNYSSITHRYTKSGTYTITLTVWDSLGCQGSFTATQNVTISNLVLDSKVDTTQGCMSHLFQFTQPPVTNGSIMWYFGDGAREGLWSTAHNYTKPGRYVVKVNITKGNCDTTYIVDTVTVLGPVAKIDNIINRFQCEIHDTVSLTDASDYSFSYGVKRLWDFDDHVANKCTTNTKTNSNINGNCNFSRDSIVGHMYTPGEERCYFPELLLIDTITGCRDSTIVPLPLMAPNAEGASFKGKPCLGPETSKTITLDFGSTLPNCLREAHWVMWDSLCARQSGNFDSSWEKGSTSHNYSYDNPPCDSNGNVTIGLIIMNGKDANGNICYDTVWYHNVLRFNDLDPRFTSNYVEGEHYCAPTSFTFTPTNQLQDSIESYTWDFGDGTVISKSAPVPVTHTYTTGGMYTVTLTVKNVDDCSGEESMVVKIGFSTNITADDEQICTGTPVNFSAKVSYLTNPGGPIDSNKFWQNPGRITSGMETMKWDFGDGTGFTSTSPNPTHTYNKTGMYTVTLALKDSAGCRDTISKEAFIKVHDVKADFATASNQMFCFQLAEFLDFSTVNTNPFIGNPQPKDSVISWYWTFGDNRRPSILQNPVHDYTYNGDFSVTLAVENTAGCKDTLTKTITIQGPQPKFRITSDSTGCAPLTVTFENQSKNTQSYIWRFGDENNTTLSTTEDTTVTFTYTKPGIYYIYLFGDDTLTDPVTGNRKYCAATYPDTNIHAKIKVVVNPTPVANFNAAVKCGYDPVKFTNTSGAGGGTFKSFMYDFGDSTTSTGTDPSHLYKQRGNYNVLLTVENVNGCTDTIQKTIFIPGLQAAFYADDTTLCLDQLVNFFDTSFHDYPLMSWNWTFGNGDISNAQHPQISYVTGGIYQVSLIITDSLNCRDTIIKPKYIEVLTKPLATEIYRATVVNNSSVNINWKKYQRYDFAFYHLYRETIKGSGNFVKIFTTNDPLDTSHTELGLNTLTTSYCYKLQVEDECGNVSDLQTFPAHCTVELTASAGVNKVLLNWSRYTGWKNGVDEYEVLREIPQQPGQYTKIGVVPGTDTTFIDSGIICYQTHFYQIRALELNGNATFSMSDTSGATPEFISTLPNPDLLTATVVDDDYVRIDLHIDYSRYPYEWHLEKSNDGNNYNFMNNLPGTSTSYNDLNVNVDARSYFYRARAQDSCGDQSNYSNYGKTILLKTDMPGDRPLITWSRYEEWPEGVENYSVQLYNVPQQQWITKAVVDSATFNYADEPPKLRQDEYCYRVVAQRVNRPNVTSTSNVDCVPVELTLFAPNAFTPGGTDSVNNGFRLKGTFVFEYHLQIYTRWGELIFESDDLYEEWDGTYKGVPCPESVYVFIAQAAGPAGQHKVITGNITLLR